MWEDCQRTQLRFRGGSVLEEYQFESHQLPLMLLNCGAGEDSWESLEYKEIKAVHPKGNQPWILIGRTDAETETSILWPPDAKSWLIGKAPDAGKDWGQEEKGQQKMRLLAGIIDSMDVNFSRLQKIVKDRKPCVLQSGESQSLTMIWWLNRTTTTRPPKPWPCLSQAFSPVLP